MRWELGKRKSRSILQAETVNTVGIPRCSTALARRQTAAQRGGGRKAEEQWKIRPLLEHLAGKGKKGTRKRDEYFGQLRNTVNPLIFKIMNVPRL